jgi:hypothetical protein
MGESIKRSLRLLTAATVVLYLALFAFGAWTYHDSRRNHQALCALRGDLQARIASSTSFLIAHPEGVAGISAKVIHDGIVNQQRTVRALHNLSC